MGELHHDLIWEIMVGLHYDLIWEIVVGLHHDLTYLYNCPPMIMKCLCWWIWLLWLLSLERLPLESWLWSFGNQFGLVFPQSGGDGISPPMKWTLSLASLGFLYLSCLVRSISSFGKVGISWFGGETFLVLQGWDLLYGTDGHCSDLHLCQLSMMTCYFSLVGFILVVGEFYLLQIALPWRKNS